MVGLGRVYEIVGFRQLLSVKPALPQKNTEDTAMPSPYPKIIMNSRSQYKHRQIHCRETALPYPDGSSCV